MRGYIHVHVHVYECATHCSVETDISSERGSAVEAIPVGARQTAQSPAVPPQGVCVQNVTSQVHVHVRCILGTLQESDIREIQSNKTHQKNGLSQVGLESGHDTYMYMYVGVLST